ncbi:MAG TPA: response regulator transcription factor [Nocardioides sp.]|jgi:DNA-binding response OmpR family regulator|uniref:response regulator transcription factor n=1 Tax=Nocardioides sp. TaxID=35761 RepID=UPI002E349A8C|nr:response regulator transcription factor [Nocardioides sp.]HEX3931059.1 response regulator transcription factor [Nocardioides sp.]
MARDRVLVIDDEPGVLRFVSRALRAEGVEVDCAESGLEGYRLALTQAYRLVVLDLVMPGLDGMSLLRRLVHHNPDQAVLILSCLTDTRSKVRALDLGASDYLGKPFALNELLARVRARMRVRSPEGVVLSTRQFELDTVRHEVTTPHTKVVLTRRESALLGELMQHAGQSVTKQRLLSEVWGYDFDPETNVVDVYVRRIRKKLGSRAIVTERGVGYGVDL